MAKAAKAKSNQEESKHEDDDTLEVRDDSSETVLDPDEPPPVDSTDAYGEGPDSPDVDYLPEAAAKSDSGEPLVTQEQLKVLHDGAERMQRPLSFLKCDDFGNYTIGEKNVTGSKLLAIPDWMIVLWTLFFKGKGVESHGHRWTELGGKAPQRPPTFTDRTKWASYHLKGKEFDPWIISYVLPLKQGSGGIVSFQSNSVPTKRAIGEVLGAFDGKRRPIVELIREADLEALRDGATRPVLKTLGYASSNENFDFLREMLIRDDPQFPEPVEKKDDWESVIGR